MSETAITIGLLALVAIIGLWIGHFKVKGSARYWRRIIWRYFSGAFYNTI